MYLKLPGIAVYAGPTFGGPQLDLMPEGHLMIDTGKRIWCFDLLDDEIVSGWRESRRNIYNALLRALATFVATRNVGYRTAVPSQRTSNRT